MLFWEMGLIDAADAATSRLASGRRRAWSARAGALWAPASEVLQGWPTIPGNSNAFGAKAVSTWPEGVAPVVWVTPSSLKAHGELGNWWAALAKRKRGVVVFSETPQGASALGQALRAEGRIPGRWKIPGHAEVWSWGWDWIAKTNRLRSSSGPCRKSQRSTKPTTWVKTKKLLTGP